MIDQSPISELNDPATATLPVDPAYRDGKSALAPESQVDGPRRFESPGEIPHVLRHPFRAVAWFVELIFGAAVLWLLLALIASVPVGNLLALGYVLEAEGRVARSGKLRHALFLLPGAARLGSIIVGFAVWLVPVWLVADAAADARWIAPDASMPWVWRVALAVVVSLVGLHLLLAIARGGGLGCFFRPIKNVRWLRIQITAGTYWPMAHAAVRDFLRAWRLPHHVGLGAVGFVGTAAWLAFPTALYATLRDSSATWQWLVTFCGGACMVPVLGWLPILQAQFSAEPRIGKMFDLRAARDLIRHAPMAWLSGTIALYALSIPLFFYSLDLKMHLPPHRGIFDLMFISLGCTLPARVFLGWACHRAASRSLALIPQSMASPKATHDTPSGWRPRFRTAFVWLSRAVLYVLVALFVWLLFHTRFTTEHSHLLLQHHSLLLPIPFSF